MWIGNVPLSCGNREIEEAPRKIGYELKSTMRLQLARDRDGKLGDREKVCLHYNLFYPSSSNIKNRLSLIHI